MGLILRQRSTLTLLLVLVATSIFATTKRDDNFLFARLGVAMASSVPVRQADNTYNVMYTVTVKNYGNETITGLQVTHIYNVEYVLSAVKLVGNVTATGSLSANSGFADGIDYGLLRVNNSKLYAGEKQTIVYTLNIDPSIVGFGPFLSFVTASGFGDLAIPVLDLSVAGLDPDPNGDGSPAEASLLSTQFSPFPVIGVAKSATAPVTQPNGTANVTYTVTVKNLGNEALKEVQVTDKLDALLNIVSPATFTIVSKPISSGTLTGNTAYNGSSNTNLLATGGTLAVGQQQTITFTVNIDPDGPTNGIAHFGPYANSAEATAKGNGSNTPTIDTSVNGNNPDPNGDGLPLEFSATPVSLIPTPIIGIAKNASSPALQPDNSYNITYKITLKNYGNTQLTNVQVTDVLTGVFLAPTTFTVSAVVASGTLVAKVGYDGSTVNNLLSTGSTLNVGATQTITFTVNVKPFGLLGPYLNTASASALGGIIPVTDVSVDGADPDPNGDGLPLELSPTISLLTPIPLIGVAKSASAPVKQSDGSYNVTFKITVKNLGNENLTNVKITDALASVFIAPSTYSIVSNVVTSGTLIANTNFNGGLITDLLANGSTLSVGATQTAQFTVNVKGTGVFLNTAIATADGSLLPTVDISIDGNEPDPNGDGLPLETLPTTVTLIPVPIIGVSKSASTPSLQSDGSYNITFTVKVQNYGNEALDNVQVTDALAGVFIGPSVYSIVGNVLTNGSLAANAGFNGGLDTNLLAPGSKLPIGGSQTVTFTVNVKPNTAFGPFINTAVATATGNSSLLLTTDLSVDGNDPDPNGDGLPLEVLPTIVNLIPFPLIGVSKSASTPVLQSDGSYLVTFTVTLKNYGNESLQNVQVTDALVSIFGSSVYSMVGGVVANGTLVANAGFNGNLVQNLLAPGSTLAVGATQKINFTVKLKASTFFGPFLNTAIATATGSLLPTTDISVDGNDPDPNGDGIPLEASPTALLLIPVPVIGLAKSASAPLLQPDGSYNITYQFTVKNLGNVRLDDVQITDVMASVFNIPAESSYSLIGTAVSSGTLIANPTFDGNTSTNLLNSGSTLEIGATQTVQVTINAKPLIFFGPFVNTAIATATGGLLPTMDISVDGTNPDPNGDGIPLETWPTVVTLVPNPVIGISKNVTSTILQADGSYNVTYDIHLKNYGNVPLSNVFVTDNLSSIFGLAAGVNLTAAVSTTGGLKANVNFDGNLDLNLLNGSQSNLPIGGSETVTYTINVKPGTVFGPYCNSAIATATGPLGVGLTIDVSHIGTNPDPNGNGKPNEAGENDCTPITFTPNPVIGIAKAASIPVLQPDGSSYNVTFTLTVKNIGNAPLTEVQVADDLAQTLPSGVSFTPVGVVTTTGTLLPNLSFTGSGDKNLLGAGSTLVAGSTATIVFTLNVIPGGNFGPFYNSAVASAKAGLQITSDISTSGTNPDPNNNGNPGDPGESAATTFSFAPNPVIGLAKAASSPLLQQADGSYNTTITFTVQNLGNVDLENVQLTDNLASVFPAPGVTYSIVGSITSPGTLLVNTAFNGNTDTSLLATGSILKKGTTEHLTLTLNLKPATQFGPFFNSASATAKAVGSAATTSDVSTDGNKPDPNGNGNPGDPGENTSTSISLTPHPVIGLAKSSGAPVLLPNGTYNVPFTLTVANLGNAALTGVQVTDNLASVIGTPATYTVVGAIGVTGSLVANTAFNGASDINLLTTASTLAVGATSTITFTINVVPNTYFGPFSNTATATGTGAGIQTTDISTGGTNPDPNGNGNPGDPGENVATSVTLTPNQAFGVALNASIPVLQPDGTYRVVFTAYIKNLGNVPFTELQVNLDLKSAIGNTATYTLISPPSTSGSLSISPTYNGNSDTRLLSLGQSIGLAASEAITIPVAIKPNGSFGPFNVSAGAAAKAAGGLNFSDLSAPGTNPDPNGNGNPGDVGENDPTPVTLTPAPVLGVAQAATAILQPDGNYKVNFVITVRNMGNIDITNVKVTNNLAVTFANAASYAMSGAVTATGSLTSNTAFNGNSDVNLLTGGTLPIGSVQLITFSVIVDGGGTLGPYFSNAYGSGTGGAITYNDISTSGTNVDPNGNGNPSDPNEDIATVINLAPSIVAGLAKAVSFVQIQADGSYRITYTFTVKNLGNTAITSLRVIDHLSATFPAPATFTMAPGGILTTGQLVANQNFDGITNVDLLATSSKLGIDASSTITMAVDVKLNGGSGTFLNSAILAAIDDDLSLSYSDISAPGSDPDPNGNGDPGDPGENSPTSVTLSPKAIIGIAKSVSTPRKQADGSFNFTYHLTIRNMGNVLLNNVQVEDDLFASFGSPATFTVTEVKSETGLVVNSAYGTAAGNKTVLGANNNLVPGAIATVDYSINLKPGASEGPFFNSARATAMGAGGTGFTSDVSVHGNNPDPNGNGNPGDPGEDDATTLSLKLQPVIGVAKYAAPPRLQDNNSYNVTYTLTLKNLGDLPLTNVGLYDNVALAFPSPAVPLVQGSLTATGSLQVDNTYDGDVQFNLLQGTSTLDVGATETVTFTVNVSGAPDDQTYYNSAIASATNEDETLTYTDISTNGIDPDPNHNGNPNDVNENVPTPVLLKLVPVLGLANYASTPVLKDDGTYDIDFIVTVENLGNEDMQGINIINNLQNTFPDPITFKITKLPDATGNLVVNPNYNGDDVIQLVESGNMGYAEQDTIEFTINVDPHNTFGVFWNSSWGSATGDETEETTQDTSEDGLDADPGRTGRPDQFNLNTATRIQLIPKEVVGVANMVSSITPLSACQYDITLVVNIENFGNSNLDNISVKDNLHDIIEVGASYSVVSVVATNGFTVNPSFNGDGDQELLAPGNTLLPFSTATITIIIRVNPNQNYGPYQNIVDATAYGPETVVADEAVDAERADPDENKLPDEKETTAIKIDPVGLSIPEGFSPNGDGTNDKFIVVLECGITANITIFNRWGDKVYTKKDYQNDWDGVSNDGSFLGKPLPDGTYFYMVELSSGDKMSSYITLKR